MRNIAILLVFLVVLGCFAGCGEGAAAEVAATTLPVYEFTARLCQGTPLTVARLVTEQVSCLHDYSLNVRQVRAAEGAGTIVISGAGLEDFLDGVLEGADLLDASQGIALLCPEEGHDHHHDHEGHHHDVDPHIWLSPANAAAMAENIRAGLTERYPAYADIFAANAAGLTADLAALQSYGEAALADLGCRELICFHDGFSYFADAFGLTVLEAIEEEAGSETSARELIRLIGAVREHDLPAVFTERNGADAAAQIIARETGCGVYQLDMAMAGDSYCGAMRHNIDTIKEALS